MDFSFQVKTKDRKSRARAGFIYTPHGEIKTPAFCPVATTAAVKALDTQDVTLCRFQVVLANTYHLYLRPGLETIKEFGGFAPFMKWDGPTMTDSGGYQVSFLRTPQGGGVVRAEGAVAREEGAEVVKITDEGAVFQSYVDGSKHLITPEKSMEIQSVLNADIIMAFDQPLGIGYSPKKAKEAFERTLLWEERSFAAWRQIQKNRKIEKRTYQALYGIAQGGTDKDLRRQSMQFVLDMDFPGIAIGGETIGVDPKITAETLDIVADLWPSDKPVHALGLGGGPEGIFEAVERGVDTFDNTSVTRLARSGLLFMYPEDGGTRENKFRDDVSKSKFKSKMEPWSNVCQCYTCQNYSASYLHHLLVARELSGFRLASIHNVYFINDLMEKIRESILNNNFVSLKKHWKIG